MLSAILLLLIVTLGGASLTYLWDRQMPLPARLAAGLAAGMTLWGLLGYTLSLRAGLNPLTVWLPALLLLSPAMIFAWPERRDRLRRDLRNLRPRLRSRGHLTYSLAFTLLALALIWFLSGAIYGKDGGYWTTNHYNHGDLPWHLAIVQGFAVGENFPPEHPEFAGVPLTYPFLVDFVAAQLVTAGAGLPEAFLLQNLSLALALLTLLHWWALTLTRNRFAFLLAPALVCFNGGWGWLTLLPLARESGQPFWNLLLHPPRDVTRDDAGLAWGNMLTTLMGTQRGFLLALPLALVVFTLLWRAFRRDDTERLPRMLAAGALAGLTPLVHGHTFLVLLLTGAALALYDLPRVGERWKGWLAYFGAAGLLALPQALALASRTAIRAESFFGIHFGWDSNTATPLDWMLFWYRNTGMLLPLLVLALLWRSGGSAAIPARLKQFYLPFALCFLAGNMLQLAPWPWDNIKVLFYFFLGAVPLVALLLGIFWERGGTGRLLAPLLALLLIFAGVLDVWRMASGQTAAAVFEQEAVAFGRLIQRETPPDARLLTAPLHTHPALLSGRRVLSGFNGHLWSHGLDFEERQAAVQKIFAGEEDAARLLEVLAVNYIVLGPPERNEASFTINEAFLAQFPVVGSVGEYRLLKVPPGGEPPAGR